MLVGYARVSTGEQNLDLQLDALNKAGCGQIYTDELSGAKTQRPGLDLALAFVRSGDTLVVWKLDRLGRSLKDLVLRIEELQSNGVGFKSLTEAIDTTNSAGKLQFHIFSALAEFERDLIRERTLAGLRSARARGRVGGRPRKMSIETIKMAAWMMKSKEMLIADILKTLKISRSSLYRYVTPQGEIRGEP